MSENVAIRLLGPLRVSDGSGDLPVASGIQARLLMFLAARRPTAPTIDQIIDALWGADPPRTAHDAIKVHVSRLRTMMGPHTLETTPSGYRLSDDVWVDVDEFTVLVGDGHQMVISNEGAGAAGTLRSALELWRGIPFADAAYDDWAQPHQRQLEGMRLMARGDLVNAQLATGRHLEALAEVRLLCTEHPLEETFWGLLMLGLYRSGKQSEALRTYQEARRIIGAELGIEPGPELANLEEQILLQDPSLLADATATHARARHNLRHPLTSLVGRSQEIRDICADVEHHRVVTLTGPGGIGKTRLATEIAFGLVEGFADGVWFVDLDRANGASHVVGLIGDALNLVDVSGVEPIDHIVQHLQSRRAALILDNCERLVPEAAAAANRILASCPRVAIIATSRERLGLTGERVHRIGPLHVGIADDADTGDAQRLFLDRARDVSDIVVADPETRALVTHVCGLLDGIPLALEIAASQLAHSALRDLAERLQQKRFDLLTSRDDLGRTGSLAVAIGSSIDQLALESIAVLEKATVFRGSFDAAAMRAVSESDVTAELQELTRKSLLEPVHTAGGEMRYRMLDTIRTFVALNVDDQAARNLRRRHAAHMASLAERIRDGVVGPDGERWLALGAEERSNLQAALVWALEEGDVDLIVQVAWATRWLSTRLGRTGDLAAWMDLLLADRDSLSQMNLLRVLTTRAALALLRGEHDIALRHGTEGAELAVALQDEPEQAITKVVMAAALAFTGRYESVPGLVVEAREIAERCGDRWALGWARTVEGTGLRLAGFRTEARQVLEIALAEFEAIGDEHGRVLPLCNLGHLDLEEQDLGRALDRCRQGLTLARESGDAILTAAALTFVSRVLMSGERVVGVRSLLREANELIADSMNRVVLSSIAEAAVWLEIVQERWSSASYVFGIAERVRDLSGLHIPIGLASGRSARLEKIRTAAGAAFDRQVDATSGLSIDACHEALQVSLSYVE